MYLLGHKRGAFRTGRGMMDSNHRKQQQQHGKGPGPRLERRNAVKNIEYEAAAATVGGFSWSSSSSASSDEAPGLRTTLSLDLSPSSYSNQTSFRIGGNIEGEVEIICRTLGISGPDDFAIPISAWEARKARSTSDLLPRSRHLQPESPVNKDSAFAPQNPTSVPALVSAEDHISSPAVEEEDCRLSVSSKPENELADSENAENRSVSPSVGGGNGGIRGVRPPVLAPPPVTLFSPPSVNPLATTPPPVLKPPPSVSLPAIDGRNSSWDNVKSFAPEDENSRFGAEGREPPDSEEDEAEIVGEEELRELGFGETFEEFTGMSSYSTMNDDDTSSTTTETMVIVSPNGRFRRTIKSWMRGVLLGSGSYGTVYEGISDEGVFFAVKEVSLLDQGSNAQQCILQLEQEIALLSQFEHENIVQYYGTDKEDAKLFIFLELITQGSLASLYKRYHLRDSQVSAYTRQILNGLNYLHDRSVVHRDIKCANILVHANGSVKLADFGLAKEMTKFSMLKSCKGSVYWMAPEVVNPRRTYGPPADIWSLGCTVLEMLTRQIPYPNLEWTQALYKIGCGEQPPIPNHLSKEARNFISQCVRVDSNERPTAAQLLDHPFVKRLTPGSSRSSSSSSCNDRWS